VKLIPSIFSTQSLPASGREFNIGDLRQRWRVKDRSRPCNPEGVECKKAYNTYSTGNFGRIVTSGRLHKTCQIYAINCKPSEFVEE